MNNRGGNYLHHRSKNLFCENTRDAIKIFGKCKKTEITKEYTTVASGLQIVFDNQPCDPFKPTHPIAQKLQSLIAQEIGVDKKYVGFYTAIGLPPHLKDGVTFYVLTKGKSISVRYCPNPKERPRSVYIDIEMDDGTERPIENVATQIAYIIEPPEYKRKPMIRKRTLTGKIIVRRKGAEA